MFGSDFFGVLYDFALRLPLDVFGNPCSIPRFEHRITFQNVFGHGWSDDAFVM
jgi:hypothetical protein